MTIKPQDIYGETAWDEMCAADPSLRVFESASQWQKGSDVAQTYLNTSSPLADFQGYFTDAKNQPLNWRVIQQKCWELYRTFGPVNASIGSKSDYAAAKGFGAYSDNLEINMFLKDLIYSYRNRLYYSIPGWMIRMQGEGELFLLLVFCVVSRFGGRRTPSMEKIIADKPELNCRCLLLEFKWSCKEMFKR